MNEQDYHYTHQLRMALSQDGLMAPPQAKIPAGYSVRQFAFDDKKAFIDLMHRVGWAQWDDDFFEEWIGRVLPQSWFLVIHDGTQAIVGSAFCVHSHTDDQPFGGELGWIAAHPDHRGRGIGRLVATLVTARFIDMGYQNIHLFTEDFRSAAIHIYLQMGYAPLLYLPQMHKRWQTVCAAIGWPFTPERWKRG